MHKFLLPFLLVPCFASAQFIEQPKNIAEKNLIITPQKQERLWTFGQKSSFTFYTVSSIADVVTTKQALDRGCSEGNPLLPNIGVTILAKLAVGGVIYYLNENGVNTTIPTTIISSLYTGAAIHNSKIKCN